MEDLGNINITIRDGAGGGGGGGSGGVGGGPNALAQRSMVLANHPIRIAQAVIRVDQAVITQFGESMQRSISGAVARATTQAASSSSAVAPFGRLARFHELQAELTAFGQRPTLGSALSLVRSNTATSQAIAGMGKAAMGVSTALVAVGAVGGAFALTLAGLQMASAHAASRIEEVWRFSSATTGAMAEQQIARFVLQIREASKNGAVYAGAIRAQTESLKAYGEMQMVLGRTTAELDIEFSRMKTAFFKFTTNVLAIAETARDIAKASPIGIAAQKIRELPFELARIMEEYSPIGIAVREIQTMQKDASDLGLSWWQQIKIGMTGLLEGDKAAVELTQEYLSEIARNTDENAGGDVANEWFQADIKAMTGLPY